MRRAASPIALATALLVAACQSGSLSTPLPSPPPSIVYRVLPPAGPIPSKDDTGRAIDVFSARLRALGIGTFTAAAGDAITFVLPPPVSDPQVRAILSTPGQVSFVPLGPPGEVQAAEGEPPPGNRNALFGADQIAAASVDTGATGGPAVTIRLKDAGARLFADYSSAHIGDLFAIVLDGRILVMPMVMSAVADGGITISMPDQQRAIPIEALAAILASGPLPLAWRQAQASRQ